MKVMIIEDEPIIRFALVRMVRDLGIDEFEPTLLTEVDYAENAIQHLENQTYDIVFIDIEGGELSGLELIDQWRERCRGTQWIIVSGYDRFDYAQKAILYGVREYLLKPITKDKLADSVRRCLKKIQEEKNHFIRTDMIDEFICKLEDGVWRLDEEFVQLHIDDWQKGLMNQYFSINYYNNVMNHILQVLTYRIQERATTLPTIHQSSIDTTDRIESNHALLKECLQMINMLKELRKGKEINPIEAAKEYILEHIDRDITLEDVANKLGFNPSYFSQIFKQKTGQTFVKYRTSLRMEKAMEILLRHDVRIIDIPFMIGLNDHPHFTKTFKEYTGYTPSGYRRKMGIG